MSDTENTIDSEVEGKPQAVATYQAVPVSSVIEKYVRRHKMINQPNATLSNLEGG